MGLFTNLIAESPILYSLTFELFEIFVLHYSGHKVKQPTYIRSLEWTLLEFSIYVLYYLWWNKVFSGLKEMLFLYDSFLVE